MLFEAETQLIWEWPDRTPRHMVRVEQRGLITFAGGIPLRTAAGELLGAVGVSGGQAAQDYAIAKAAINVLAAPDHIPTTEELEQ